MCDFYMKSAFFSYILENRCLKIGLTLKGVDSIFLQKFFKKCIDNENVDIYNISIATETLNK